MNIIQFNKTHLEQAQKIAHENYNAEKRAVPALPEIESLPDLSDFAMQNRGVAAVSGEELVGFLCWCEPFENHFGLTKGTWTPIHAHGVSNNVQFPAKTRAEIYDRLYQAAAEGLVKELVFSFAVTLYEHDEEAKESFAYNGFGRRCIDAIRETTPISVPLCEGVSFKEADENDAEVISEMDKALSAHMKATPIFMPYVHYNSADEIRRQITAKECRYFVACNPKPVAFLKLQNSGETFVSEHNSVMNITGAYALPQERGKGVSTTLLSWLTNWLRERGYTRFGVDYECFNYTARKFWGKYFIPYTSGVVRRIDERI